MKAVILCGGRGTRLGEETQIRPKPMVDVGGKPILSHILEIYRAHGVRDFVLALGYKGEIIRDYFDRATCSRMGIALEAVDTGLDTQTGGRVHRLRERLRGERFMLTYGDGVANVDLRRLLEFHRAHGRLATLTAVRPPARFGEVFLDGDRVVSFKEKPQTSAGWINGGFFVFEPKVLDYIGDETTVLEKEPLENLARDGELLAFQHGDFWQCMDTPRDRDLLDSLVRSGEAPWMPRER
jgi:glucose-1-phosphate cytidylyltransferase